MTCKQFSDYMKEHFKVDVCIITTNRATLIQTFLPSAKDRYGRLLEEIYAGILKAELNEKTKYLVLEVSADTEDGATALLPLIKYVFRK